MSAKAPQVPNAWDEDWEAIADVRRSLSGPLNPILIACYRKKKSKPHQNPDPNPKPNRHRQRKSQRKRSLQESPKHSVVPNTQNSTDNSGPKRMSFTPVHVTAPSYLFL
jgi:hypothetical protein